MTSDITRHRPPVRKSWTRPVDPWPWLIGLGLVLLMVVINRLMGRLWWCEGGEPWLWISQVRSSHNSQHLADPYSFTHVAHGLIFAVLFAYLPMVRRLAFAWRLVPALGIEVLWEIIENTPLVINRYRETTMALGYTGDTIANSLGDIACFVLGFLFASRIAWYWSLGLFLAMELTLTLTIRDSLLLNILMLFWPIEAIKTWQMGGAGP